MNIYELTLALRQDLLAMFGYYEEAVAAQKQLPLVGVKLTGQTAFDNDIWLQEGWEKCYCKYAKEGFSDSELQIVYQAVVDHIVNSPQYYDDDDDNIDEARWVCLREGEATLPYDSCDSELEED